MSADSWNGIALIDSYILDCLPRDSAKRWCFSIALTGRLEMEMRFSETYAKISPSLSSFIKASRNGAAGRTDKSIVLKSRRASS